jgi:hypothetical protein
MMSARVDGILSLVFRKQLWEGSFVNHYRRFLRLAVVSFLRSTFLKTQS